MDRLEWWSLSCWVISRWPTGSQARMPQPGALDAARDGGQRLSADRPNEPKELVDRLGELTGGLVATVGRQVLPPHLVAARGRPGGKASVVYRPTMPPSAPLSRASSICSMVSFAPLT